MVQRPQFALVFSLVVASCSLALGQGERQVILRSRIAEVQRTALRELGIDLTSPGGSTFFAPTFTIPLSEDPPLGTLGAGVTVGREWAVLSGNDAMIGGVLSLDMLLSGFNPDARLIPMASQSQFFVGETVFALAVRPGVRGRFRLLSRGPIQNLVLDAGGVFGVKTTGFRNAGPGSEPVFAKSLESNDYVAGYYAGAGLEMVTANGRVIRPMFTVHSYSTNFMTGIRRQEVGFGVRVEVAGGIPLLKDLPLIGAPFRQVLSRRDRRGVQMMVTPRIIIQEEEEELQ